MKIKMRYKPGSVVFLIILLVVLPLLSFATPPESVPKPGSKETCPVCGMFVSLYPEWVASIHYKNGIIHYFDGTKDMFIYLNDMKKWAQNRKKENITAIRVTEYYTLQPIDGKKSFYVTGSDVLGPMGHELIPFLTMDDAKNFFKDHNGKRIISFNEVTDQMLINIDNGIFK